MRASEPCVRSQSPSCANAVSGLKPLRSVWHGMHRACAKSCWWLWHPVQAAIGGIFACVSPGSGWAAWQTLQSPFTRGRCAAWSKVSRNGRVRAGSFAAGSVSWQSWQAFCFEGRAGSWTWRTFASSLVALSIWWQFVHATSESTCVECGKTYAGSFVAAGLSFAALGPHAAAPNASARRIETLAFITAPPARDTSRCRRASP